MAQAIRGLPRRRPRKQPNFSSVLRIPANKHLDVGLPKKGIEIAVNMRGKRFGTLEITQRMISWRPTKDQTSYRMNWLRFQKLIEQNY
jgi:hypothetical protein